MNAAIYPIHCKRGLGYHRTLTLKNGDGSVMDLSNYTVRLRYREARAGAEDVDLTITTVPEDGIISINWLSTFVDTLPAYAEYRLDLIDATGEPSPLMTGAIKVSTDL